MNHHVRKLRQQTVQ